MAERDFHNANDLIAYPLVHGDDFSLSGGGDLPSKGMVGAGFLLGMDSGFVVATHDVRLHAVVVGGGRVQFDFRCNAPGMTGYRWLFDFDEYAGFECTDRLCASAITTGLENSHKGYGFLTIGDLTDIRALGAGTHALSSPPRVEPALVQSLVDTFARQVTVANDPRECPPECCSSSSSSSSSSESESSPSPEDTAYVHTVGLVGDVKLKEGYNAHIEVDEADNIITIDAVLGAGEGEVCEDVIIDESGFRRGEECTSCDAYIKTINGIATQNGKLRLVRGTGLSIIPDADNHKLTVAVDVEKLCT